MTRETVGALCGALLVGAVSVLSADAAPRVVGAVSVLPADAAPEVYAPTCTSTAILYAETAGTHFTAAADWTPIPGLAFTLPATNTSARQSCALITLNLPNPYARGTDYPGGTFGITVNNAVLINIGQFSTETESPVPGNTGRIPTTLIVLVPLLNFNTQAIQAVWKNVRGSTVYIDTPSTLSAVIL